MGKMVRCTSQTLDLLVLNPVPAPPRSDISSCDHEHPQFSVRKAAPQAVKCSVSVKHLESGVTHWISQSIVETAELHFTSNQTLRETPLE